MKNMTFRERVRWAIKFIITGDWAYQSEPLVITTTYRRVDHE